VESLRVTLPVGLVYDDEGSTVVDPDEEVRAAITDLFAAFRAGGSAYQVVAASRAEIPIAGLWRVWAGQLRWGRLTHSRVLGVLSNPAFAGTYVFGRYHSHRVVDPTRQCTTR